jgi:hypothetical protein
MSLMLNNILAALYIGSLWNHNRVGPIVNVRQWYLTQLHRPSYEVCSSSLHWHMQQQLWPYFSA